MNTTLCESRFPYLQVSRASDMLSFFDDDGRLVEFPAGRLYSFLAGYPDVEMTVVLLLGALEALDGQRRRVTALNVLFVVETLWPLAADGESMIPSFTSFLRDRA